MQLLSHILFDYLYFTATVAKANDNAIVAGAIMAITINNGYLSGVNFANL
jgi:hypothetical protein